MLSLGTLGLTMGLQNVAEPILNPQAIDVLL